MNRTFVFFLLFAPLVSLAQPRRLRLVQTDDPATTITIAWEQPDSAGTLLFYDWEDHGTQHKAYSFLQQPHQRYRIKGMLTYVVHLSELIPDRSYFFVISDGKQHSKRYYFRTAPDNPQQLSFIAGGDSRNNREPRQKANHLVAKLRPNAVLFGGDMTNKDTPEEWQQWFDDWQLTIAGDGQIFPIIPARGNHEANNRDVARLFGLPYPGVYYGITYGHNLARIYTLNSLSSVMGFQQDWLRSDLQMHRHTTWKLAQYHFPMRPHYTGKIDAVHQYAVWAPLFAQYQLDLAVECDAHTVKTTWPISPFTGKGSVDGFIRDDTRGTVYTGEGCWGAPLRSNNDNRPWTRASGKFNQFKWIWINRDTLEMRTIRVDREADVEALPYHDRFRVPQNLDVWKPETGEVVRMPARQPTMIKTQATVPVSRPEDDGTVNPDGIATHDTPLIKLDHQYSAVFNFRDIPIPRGARIEKARLQLSPCNTDQTPPKIGVVASSHLHVPVQLAHSDTLYWCPEKLTGREWHWSCMCFEYPDSLVGSPDISSLIQSLVDNVSWHKGMNIRLDLYAGGPCTFQGFEDNPVRSARLMLEWSVAGSENKPPTHNKPVTLP